jgi:hypothetical protein
MSLSTMHVSAIRNLGTGVVPTTKTPGATDLHVAEMIQMVYDTWPSYRQVSFRVALDQVELMAFEQYGVTSDQFTQKMSIAFVVTLAQQEHFRAFWIPFRTMVVLMYYGHPVGAASIGMPGPSIDTGGFTPDGERIGGVH